MFGWARAVGERINRTKKQKQKTNLHLWVRNIHFYIQLGDSGKFRKQSCNPSKLCCRISDTKPAQDQGLIRASDDAFFPLLHAK